MQSVERITVIADDLTGAADTGVHFTLPGESALLITHPQHTNIAPLSPNTLVINTESRDVTEKEAVIRLESAIGDHQGGLLFKKIDSTLRGHPALELDVLMKVWERDKALICPAYPKQGRRLVEGRMFIGDQPLMETEFAREPSSPWTDNIRLLLEEKTTRRVIHLRRSAYRSGSEQLVRRIDTIHDAIVVIDAKNQADIEIVGQAVTQLGTQVVACGSAGLAESIGKQLGSSATTPLNTRPLCSRVLIVSGSRREATRAQIHEALSRKDVTEIEVSMAADSPGLQFTTDIGDHIAHKPRSFILSTAQLEYRAGSETMVSTSLAELVLSLMEPLQVDALILTGGATALAVCDALSAPYLEIQREVLPGIPLCRITSGPYRDIRVVTKAGGFGDRIALVEVIRYLQGGQGDAE